MLLVVTTEGNKDTEANIVINGVELTNAQSMALRVAVTTFNGDMASDPDRLGTDEHGRTMTKAYRERTAEILSLIFRNLDR